MVRVVDDEANPRATSTVRSAVWILPAAATELLAVAITGPFDSFGCCGQRHEFPETVEASARGVAMSEKRMKYDQEFRDGAVRIVRETGKADRGGGA